MTDSDDNNDLPFAISEDLVQSPVHKAAGTSLVDFDGLLADPLRLHEDLKEGCGGQLWPAGMLLAKYMLQYHSDDLADKEMFGLLGLVIPLICSFVCQHRTRSRGRISRARSQ
jgi:protein N-lysine methyltransferase METTL21A